MEIHGYFKGSDPFIHIYFEQSAEPVEVLLDTGFSGELMLQRERIDRLALLEIGEEIYITASGAEEKTTVHLGSLKWGGKTKMVSVLATDGETALVGMGLLFHHSLWMKPSDGILQIK